MSTSYVNSVQNISINIPSGSASATLTVAAPTGTYFLLNSGEQSNVTDPHAGLSRIEITNSTTITAYRNASAGSATVTANGVLVDATSNLIKSVQSGTISISTSSATTGTASISSVTNANTVVHLLGCTTNNTGSFQIPQHYAVLSLSGTTVTATRQVTSTFTLVVGFIVIEFQSAALNQSVQNFAVNWTTSSTSTTQSITSVNTNNAIIIAAGFNGSAATNEASDFQDISLTNSTTVTIHVNTANSVTANSNFSVVEFASGVLSSNVQRGTTTLTGVTSNTSTITSVGSFAVINWLNNTSSATTSNMINSLAQVALTNATTVTVSRNGSGNNVTGSWEVFEITHAAAPAPAGGAFWFSLDGL